MNSIRKGEGMKFYIASSFKNIESVRNAAEELKSRGFIHTYDWTNGRASSIAELEAIGSREKNAIMEADIVIILLPAGKGSHVELGIALATDKKIFLYSPDESVNDLESTSTFYHVPEVEKVIGTIAELVRKICSQAVIS